MILLLSLLYYIIILYYHIIILYINIILYYIIILYYYIIIWYYIILIFYHINILLYYTILYYIILYYIIICDLCVGNASGPNVCSGVPFHNERLAAWRWRVPGWTKSRVYISPHSRYTPDAPHTSPMHPWYTPDAPPIHPRYTPDTPPPRFMDRSICWGGSHPDALPIHPRCVWGGVWNEGGSGMRSATPTHCQGQRDRGVLRRDRGDLRRAAAPPALSCHAGPI